MDNYLDVDGGYFHHLSWYSYIRKKGMSVENFVTISALLLKLQKKLRVWTRMRNSEFTKHKHGCSWGVHWAHFNWFPFLRNCTFFTCVSKYVSAI